MKTLAERFAEFDRKHPEVWSAFKSFALEVCVAVRNRGGNRVGAKMIWERLRYETAVGELEGDYRLNNTWVAFYARKFRDAFPDFADLIEIRGEDEPESIVDDEGQHHLPGFAPEPAEVHHMH